MAADKPLNDQLDEELDDSFPASDPPSLTEPTGDARRRRRQAEEVREPERTPRPPTKH